jgi:hypothetical protein
MASLLWLRELVASLSLWKPGFSPGLARVGFVVETVALGQFLFDSFRFTCHYLSTHAAIYTSITEAI